MSRYIINNKSKLPDKTAIAMVCNVIDEGKISNSGKQYCYATAFATATVYADLRRSGTHSFSVVGVTKGRK